MTSRTALLMVVLAVIGGCDMSYGYRQPCDEDAGSACCPPGSHRLVNIDPETHEIICEADETPDAEADAGICEDAGPDAP